MNHTLNPDQNEPRFSFRDGLADCQSNNDLQGICCVSGTATDAREVKMNPPRAPLQTCPHRKTGEQVTT